jgi:hypothetical protein
MICICEDWIEIDFDSIHIVVLGKTTSGTWRHLFPRFQTDAIIHLRGQAPEGFLAAPYIARSVVGHGAHVPQILGDLQRRPIGGTADVLD